MAGRYLQKLPVGLGCGLALGGMLFLFFKSIWMLLAGGILGLFIGPVIYIKWQERRESRQRRNEFRECLEIMIPVLQSGRSMEGTIRALLETDMDEEEMPWMYRELQMVRHGMELNRPVEELFEELGERSGITEIRDFAEILRIGKRSSGDITGMMRDTAGILKDKMEAEEELRVILAKRKLEQRILGGMPFVIFIMLWTMSPGYLEPLYQSLEGRMIMVVCVLMMGFSYYLSFRMGRITI